MSNSLDPDQARPLVGPDTGQNCLQGLSRDDKRGHYQAKSWSEKLLSSQPRVTVTSCFAYKVIEDLESIDSLCINSILGI